MINSFRTRDCEANDIFLYAQTQPTIEASANMRFGCFQFNYPQLLDQFAEAKLQVFVNEWSRLYDFSRSTEGNWKCLTLEEIEQMQPIIKFPESILCTSDRDHSIDIENPKKVPYPLAKDGTPLQSVIPRTIGGIPKPFKKTRFVLFVPAKVMIVLQFVQEVWTVGKDHLCVVCTKRTKIQIL
jgi:protein XRP2